MARLMGLMDVHEIPATSVKYKLATRLRHYVLTQCGLHTRRRCKKGRRSKVLLAGSRVCT